MQLRAMSQQYSLPDPLFILQSPPAKEAWKRSCKSAVISWWEERLRGEASLLPSLKYFHPGFMSLNTPHPLWKYAESPFEVKKAATVALMISGRYVTDHRSRHWSVTNRDGHCQLCLAVGHPSTPGTIEHLLLRCPALSETRTNAVSMWSAYMVDKPYLLPIVKHHTIGLVTQVEPIHLQLLLDPASCPMVITAVQECGLAILSHLLYMTRTWCYSHHLKRHRLLKLLNII